MAETEQKTKKPAAKKPVDLTKLSIEELFEGLNQTIQKMDDSSVSLEETFQLYELGMKAVKEAGSRIDEVEKKIRILDGEEEA
ncbi:Exodeoxyribonuclease VII small subunit [[Clostridium] aminophilum]|uniref:Exodeoxyribonuclease VII small subunit n=1 Tax=[Clostridium] aminophilum TaxID=1526 RepID=A0A1I0F4X9_9FIRM|nr:exodeoxyribonuclease VII small subunit [[Clostridium] aminophilum]SET52998.1 Exodeoxyribonuclease VII small subunit [[Clostridium] aminophilum]